MKTYKSLYDLLKKDAYTIKKCLTDEMIQDYFINHIHTLYNVKIMLNISKVK